MNSSHVSPDIFSSTCFFASLMYIQSSNQNIKLLFFLSPANHGRKHQPEDRFEEKQKSRHERSWHDTSIVEIGAFLDVLLYMDINVLPRTRDYWNIDVMRSFHPLIVNCMGRIRWKQIKRFLKISNSLKNQKVDTRDPDWWKKLESLMTAFRKTSKTYWLPDNHVSINEQLVKFKRRSCHILQIACKAIGIGFKFYSLCQENFLYDFCLTSKVNFDVEKWNFMVVQLMLISEWKSTSWKQSCNSNSQLLNGNWLHRSWSSFSFAKIFRNVWEISLYLLIISSPMQNYSKLWEPWASRPVTRQK